MLLTNCLPGTFHRTVLRLPAHVSRAVLCYRALYQVVLEMYRAVPYYPDLWRVSCDLQFIGILGFVFLSHTLPLFVFTGSQKE